MIDLNKYYISSTFQGASGGSEGRAGYVPQALSGDELKFLRGDGTWQTVQAGSTQLDFLPLSGGTLTGNLSVYGNTFINNNLTVGGNISALGTATFANTIFTTTSALSVYNTGPGPALYVYQSSGPYDVASFYDGDGIEVLHVGNAGPGGFGKVGVNESFPNEELTVRGSISATETIYANRIGIGTSNPNSALTVSGNISASGSSSFTSLSVLGPSNKTILTTNLTEDGTVVIGATGPHAQTILFTPRSASIYSMGTNGTVGKIHSTGTTEGIGINNNLGINGYISIGTFSSTVRLYNEGANILAQRTGSPFSNLSPQTYRLYNSYTDASNYQRGTLTHTNSSLVIGTEYTTTAGNSALSGQAMPIILAPGYNQSLSATAPIVLQQTWNNANNAFTLLSANVTDNASNSNSRLIDLQVNGNTFFNVDKTGTIRFGNSGGTQNRLQLFGDSVLATDVIVNSVRCTNGGRIAGTAVQTTAGGSFEWVPGSNIFDTPDLRLFRDAPSTLALRNGLSAQTFRIYNTYTAGTPVSSEFGYLQWSGNTLQLGTSATGSGSARALQFQVGGTTRFQITSVGALALGSVITVWENTAGMYISNNGAGINFNNGLSISNNGGFENGSGGRFRWKDSALVTSGSYDLGFQRNSAGVLEINNGTAGTFRDVVVRTLNFGGTTAAFPALKNSLSGIQIRRADDSDFAPLTASNITATNYLSAGVNLLDIFSGGGGGGTVEKRFDFVTTGGIDYSYSGTAAQYTIETSPTWKLIRLTYNNNGTISNSASALDSWTGRLTATYV